MRIKEVTMKNTTTDEKGAHKKFYVLQQLDCTKEDCNKCDDQYTCSDSSNRHKVNSDFGRMLNEEEGVAYQNRKTENSCLKHFPNAEAAEKFFWKKYQEKLKKGYTLTFERVKQ